MKGWTYFALAQSRLIIGAKSVDPIAADSAGYVYRATAGAETVTLNENQMPSHSHPVRDLEREDRLEEWGHTVDGNGDRFRLSANDGPPFEEDLNTPITGRLTAAPTGGDEAHENMPPYVALYFCIKD